MTPDLRAVLSEADFAFLDATFYDDHELPGRDMRSIPHPRVVDTLEIVRGVQRRAEVVLIHMNHTNRLWVDEDLTRSLRTERILVGRHGAMTFLS